MKVKILVVEDEYNLRKAIVEFFKKNGDYEIFQAADAKGGIRIFVIHSPDIVITELNMPGMRGEELVRHIKRDPRISKIRVIAMSGEPYLEPVAKAAGCDVFLKKPFHLLQLHETVERLLKKIV